MSIDNKNCLNLRNTASLSGLVKKAVSIYKKKPSLHLPSELTEQLDFIRLVAQFGHTLPHTDQK